MADVEIILGPTDNPLSVMNGTGVEESRKTDNDSTVCFDGVVQEGSEQAGFEITVDRLSYESMDDYIALDAILEDMIVNPGHLTIREIIRFKDEKPYLLKRVYGDVLLADDKYKMEPNKKAVMNLTFNAGSRKKSKPTRLKK